MMMDGRIRVRDLQRALCFAYAVVAIGAVARLGSAAALAAAIALALIGYASSRPLPADFHVSSEHIWKVIGVGAVILLVGSVFLVIGGEEGLGFTSSVLAYCAGNRFRASELAN